jgi:hypothetical protein
MKKELRGSISFQNLQPSVNITSIFYFAVEYNTPTESILSILILKTIFLSVSWNISSKEFLILLSMAKNPVFVEIVMHSANTYKLFIIIM